MLIDDAIPSAIFASVLPNPGQHVLVMRVRLVNAKGYGNPARGGHSEREIWHKK
jgi:hypothetical protein